MELSKSEIVKLEKLKDEVKLLEIIKLGVSQELERLIHLNNLVGKSTIQKIGYIQTNKDLKYPFLIQRDTSNQLISEYLEFELNQKFPKFRAKLKQLLNALLVKYDEQIEFIKENKSEASLIRSLEGEVLLLKRFHKLIESMIRELELPTILNLPFITHTPKEKDSFYKILRSGLLKTSAIEEQKYVKGFTTDFDKLFELDRFVFFGIGWGITSSFDYSFIFNVKKFLELDIEINFVKIDLIYYLELFKLLFLISCINKKTGKPEPGKKAFIEELGEKRVKYFVKTFSNQNVENFWDLPSNINLEKFLKAFHRFVPEDERTEYILKFKKKFIDRMQKTNRKEILAKLKEYSTQSKFTRMIGRLMFTSSPPEIRTASPFHIFNSALIGFYVPSERRSQFFEFINEKFGNRLDNYTIFFYEGGKIKYSKIGKLRPR